jgi:hypothetical protein
LPGEDCAARVRDEQRLDTDEVTNNICIIAFTSPREMNAIESNIGYPHSTLHEYTTSVI